MVFDGFHYVKCVKMNFTWLHARFRNFRAFEHLFFRRKLLVHSKFDDKLPFSIENAEISHYAITIGLPIVMRVHGKSQYFNEK